MKVTLLFLLLSGFFLTDAQDDEAQILQKCVDLPQLQDYYPRDVNGRKKQLHVLRHGISFPENIQVSANGKNLSFLSKDQIGAADDVAYFLFHEFNVSETSARIAFVYQNNQKPLVVVNLELTKTGDTWSITKSQIEKR